MTTTALTQYQLAITITDSSIHNSTGTVSNDVNIAVLAANEAAAENVAVAFYGRSGFVTVQLNGLTTIKQVTVNQPGSVRTVKVTSISAVVPPTPATPVTPAPATTPPAAPVPVTAETTAQVVAHTQVHKPA
jgi:hypothetical protein